MDCFTQILPCWVCASIHPQELIKAFQKLGLLATLHRDLAKAERHETTGLLLELFCIHSRHLNSHWWSNFLLVRDGKDGPSKGHITWLMVEISKASFEVEVHGGD